MRVLFLPNYGPDNPYQKELAQALEKYKVKVSPGGHIDRAPLRGVIRLCGKLDVLHLHWTSPFLLSRRRSRSLVKATLFLLTLLWVKLVGVKIVWTVHNLTDHERQDPGLERFFNRILCRIYDQIIVHCSFARDAIQRDYRLPDQVLSKVSVIPHGNFVGSYENHLSQSQAKQRLNLDDRETVFLFFGQIRPYKGVCHLISAFQKLDDPRARLLIAGRPADETIKSELERRQQDKRIRLHLTFVPEEDVQLYMNAADVVVLPFQAILSSSTVLLAMSFGRAIITPRLGCMAETLDERGAFLYNPKQEDGLLLALQEALGADLAEMGKRNYERARRFDWHQIAQKNYAVYQRCFAQPGPKSYTS
jgi:beta-1,4-mannosyltransferase